VVTEIGIGEAVRLILLREGVGDRQRRVAAELLDDSQPLLLVHGVARDEEGQHVLHPRVVGHVV
jgi:hypothetical protein